MNALAQAFDSEDAVVNASMSDFQNVRIGKHGRLLGKDLCEKLFAVKSGAANADIFNGEVREVVWNKITKKKVKKTATNRGRKK